MILLLALLLPASAATVHVETDQAIQVRLAGSTEDIKARKSADFKRIDEGTHRIEVLSGGAVRWAGDLGLPDKAEVWLTWRGDALVLTAADREVSGFEKASGTAMAIGAGAQAASDVAGAASAAGQDMQAVSRGEATESSHTEIQVSGGPGGMQTSTSRTTAGASGVHAEGTSTSIGPDGVSRSTGSVDVDGAGIRAEDGGYSVSRVQIPGKGDLVVTLVQVGTGEAPAAAAVAPAVAAPTAAVSSSATPAPAATPAAAPIPPSTAPVPDAKLVVFRAGQPTQVSGTSWRFLDPIAEEALFKVQIRVTAPNERGLLWEPSTAVVRLNDVEVPGRGKTVAAAPGQEEKQTVVFEARDTEHRAAMAYLGLGDVWFLDKGAALAVGRLDGADASATAGDLTCTVKRLSPSKKGVEADVECANGGDGWILAEPAAARLEVGGSGYANVAKKSEPLLIGPGDDGKLSIAVAQGGTSAAVLLDGVFHQTVREAVYIDTIVLEMDPDASK